MSAHIDFNTKICEVLGLDINKVGSYLIMGDGDGVTINVEWLGPYDADTDSIKTWTQRYKIVEDGEPREHE